MVSPFFLQVLKNMFVKNYNTEHLDCWSKFYKDCSRILFQIKILFNNMTFCHQKSIKCSNKLRKGNFVNLFFSLVQVGKVQKTIFTTLFIMPIKCKILFFCRNVLSSSISKIFEFKQERNQPLASTNTMIQKSFLRLTNLIPVIYLFHKNKCFLSSQKIPNPSKSVPIIE